MKRRAHLERIRSGTARCHYCGRALDRGEATVDHVVPRALGGRLSRLNVVPSCAPCNEAKDDTFPTCRCPHCAEAVLLWMLDRLVLLDETQAVGSALDLTVAGRVAG